MAAQKSTESTEETLAYYEFRDARCRQIRTKNRLETILRVVRRRTRVVDGFPDGNSALMLVVARSRHLTGTRWGARPYLNTNLPADVREGDEAPLTVWPLKKSAKES